MTRKPQKPFWGEKYETCSPAKAAARLLKVKAYMTLLE